MIHPHLISFYVPFVFLFLFVHQHHLHLHHKNKKILLPQPPRNLTRTPKPLESNSMTIPLLPQSSDPPIRALSSAPGSQVY